MPIRDPDAPLTERRVLIYGVTGSGKSTAATRLAAATGLPLHLADELTWRPGWLAVPTEVQREIFAEIAAGDTWVLDTAYGTWRDVVLPRCQLIVGLDYPRWLSLARLARRTVARLIDRHPICNGNVETLRNAFSRDSIVVWHFRSFASKRERMRDWAANPDGPPVLLFRHPTELDRWLSTLESTTGTIPAAETQSTAASDPDATPGPTPPR